MIKELFRYARLAPPKIIDLQYRAETVPALKDALAGEADRLAWARKFLESDQAVAAPEDLAFDYFAHLTLKSLPTHHLPTSAHLTHPETFDPQAIRKDKAYKADCANTLISLYALKTLMREIMAAEVAKILHFLEVFPNLADILEPRPYASAILQKVIFKKPAIQILAPAGGFNAKDKEKREELQSLSSQLRLLWGARNNLLQAKRNSFQAELRKFESPAPDVAPARKPKPAKTAKSAKPSRSASAKAKAKDNDNAEKRSSQLVALRAEYKTSAAASTLGDMLSGHTKDLAVSAGKNEREIGKIQTTTSDLLDKYGIATHKFCEAYHAAQVQADAIPSPVLDEDVSAQFPEYPVLDFQDNIKLVGSADLIRVDETVMGYQDGEISYIENVLFGEVRKREVKNSNYYEELSESTKEDMSENGSETSTTAKQELSSEIETEFKSSLKADVNSSVSGNGSGQIGVVDFEGSGSAGASMGVGVDVGLDTKNSSNLSHEIVNKAMEKVKKSSVEKRMTRMYSMLETLNSHTIDNSGAGGATRNGYYTFLDKRVCISETKYGKRMFMVANVAMPGRSLLNAARHRRDAAEAEYGDRPIFKLSPADITPENYQKLVAQYKASGVQVPPPPTLTLGKTYKTDTTNANVEQQEFKPEKIAQMLTPLFAKYKRFLVTDSLKLPDGYELREVRVTVNHGENGISMPADLPLKIAGASISTGLNVAAGAVTGLGLAVLLPLAIWQFEYSISPILHYNSDSSHVIICIGNESQDSSYYYFKAEVLMRELSNFLGNIAGLADSLKANLNGMVETLRSELNRLAEKVPGEFMKMVGKIVYGLVDNINSVLDSLKIKGSLKDLINGFKPKLTELSYTIHNLDDLLKGSEEAMKAMFGPLENFLKSAISMIGGGLSGALGDLLALLASNSDPVETFQFAGAQGLRGDVPVSLNFVSINPGVTVNLVACVSRTQAALDRWRLDTFNALYQGYQRLSAEYQSRMLMARDANRMSRSPGSLRGEEMAALKERILHLLNNYHRPNGNSYDLPRMNLFENGIDWKNVSFRLFNYGPNADDLEREKDGVFLGCDERRKAFLKALWVQVLIPAQPLPHLEKQVAKYFEDGTADLEGELREGELAALYQDLIVGRELIRQDPVTTLIRTDTVPTDLIRVGESLPTYPKTCCETPA